MPRKKKAGAPSEPATSSEAIPTETKDELTKRKPARKPTIAKTPTEKAPKETVMVQFAGKEYDVDAIKAAVKADIKGKVKGKIKIIDIYIKPEDGAAYYVANELAGKVEL